MARLETKGHRCGFVRRVHVTPAKRFLSTSHGKIQQTAYDWQDLDYSVVRACDDLIAAIDEFEKCFNESVDVMNEPAEQD